MLVRITNDLTFPQILLLLSRMLQTVEKKNNARIFKKNKILLPSVKKKKARQRSEIEIKNPRFIFLCLTSTSFGRPLIFSSKSFLIVCFEGRRTKENEKTKVQEKQKKKRRFGET